MRPGNTVLTDRTEPHSDELAVTGRRPPICDRRSHFASLRGPSQLPVSLVLCWGTCEHSSVLFWNAKQQRAPDMGHRTRR